MSGTGMPRGMLRGCQQRVATFEKRGICLTLIVAAVSAVMNLIAAGLFRATDIFREKDWWEIEQ